MFSFFRQRIIFLALIILTTPSLAEADTLLEKRDFFVDPLYDLEQREKTTAVLQTITDRLYFYLDANWWDSLDIEKRKEINMAIADLDQEFKNNIYPILTSVYGSEWRPGIDNDSRLTILIHPMAEKAGGYFNSGDEYPKIQNPSSNQREMIYLNSKYISSLTNKSFLAHEFLHLITFNQKDRIRGLSEDTWLNEARAEYAPTLLGYDKNYQNSNLQRRAEQFLSNPQDSLTEWQGKSVDYGVLNIFTQYLVDHYSIKILSDSLQSDKTGIASVNYALQKNGFKEDFSQIFTDWTIAIFINNCGINPKYCYLNDNLKNFKITPFIYYLPNVGESTLSVGYLTKEWAGNWQKIIGGKKSLKLEFSGESKTNFKVPYIIENSNGLISVKFLALDQSQKSTIYLTDNGISSFTLIPSAQSKTSNFSDEETSYQFSWLVKNENPADAELIKNLLEKIAYLQAEIVRLQAQIATKNGGTGQVSCLQISQNLYYGITNNQEVRCLQEFLKNQGQEIYPEAIISGNFLSLTKTAVIRFQEKYASEILAPLGLEKGTGFVGSSTRAKINELVGF